LNKSLLFIWRQIARSLSCSLANTYRNGGGSKASPINFFTSQSDEV
jgi:hypothetical protein